MANARETKMNKTQSLPLKNWVYWRCSNKKSIPNPQIYFLKYQWAPRNQDWDILLPNELMAISAQFEDRIFFIILHNFFSSGIWQLSQVIYYWVLLGKRKKKKKRPCSQQILIKNFLTLFILYIKSDLCRLNYSQLIWWK